MILKMISSQIKNPLIKMIIDQNNLDSYTLSSETNFKKMSLAEKEWEIIKLLNRVEGSDGTNFVFGKHTQIQSIDEGYDQLLCSVFSHIAHHKVDMDIIDYMVDNSEHIRTNTTLHTPLEFYLLCYSIMVKEDVMYLQAVKKRC